MQEDPRQKYRNTIPFQYTLKHTEAQLDQMRRDLAETEQIMSEDEQRVVKDLELEFGKRMRGLEHFLAIEYASFQNKVGKYNTTTTHKQVFKCIHNRCYADVFRERSEIT